MPITPQDVIHVAKLARLDLSPDEIEQFTGQLGDILEHASRISALDLGDVEPTAHPIPLTNVLRQDIVRPSLTPEKALANAPEAEDQKFRVPRILEVEETDE